MVREVSLYFVSSSTLGCDRPVSRELCSGLLGKSNESQLIMESYHGEDWHVELGVLEGCPMPSEIDVCDCNACSVHRCPL